MEQKLNRLVYFLIALSVFVLPIWTIPGISGSIALHKMFFFVALSGILALIWAARTVVTKRVWLSLTPINVGFLALAVITAVSGSIIGNPFNQLSGRFLLVAASAVFLLFGTALAPKLRWETVLRFFLWSGVVLSIFTILQLTPLSPSVWIGRLLGTSIPEGLLYSLADNHLILLTFLVPVGLSGLVAGWQSLRKKPAKTWQAWATSPLLWSIVALLTGGLVLFLTLTQSSLSVAFLPFSQGWQIMIENLKSAPRALMGVGPENFGAAFHHFRTVEYNATDIWSVRFTSSSSELLHSISTTGLLSLAAWVAIWGAVLHGIRRSFRQQPALAVFLLSYFVLFFFLPFNHLVFFLLSIGLLVLSNHLQAEKPGYAKDIIFLLSAIRIANPHSLKSIKTQAGFSLVLALVVTALAATGLFFAGRVYAASIAFELSRQAAVQNKAREVYQFQQYAATFNPYSPLYHRTYALTNLAIAKQLARTEDLTEEQRVLVGRVLQQTIREVRLATLLNPQETENWEALSSVYSQIIDVGGAKEWAVASMVQSIQTDPISPVLRLNLGNLYLTLGENDLALRLIEQAIQLKPDFANTYISYGTALERKDEPALSAQAYQRALDLLGPNFDGADQLRQKITELKAIAQERDEARQEKDAEATKKLPPASSPTLPVEKPTVQNPPDEFGDIVEGRNPQDQPTAPQATPVVLPSDVGF